MTWRSWGAATLMLGLWLALPDGALAFHTPPWDTGHQSFDPGDGDQGTDPGTGDGCHNCNCSSKGMSPVEAATGNFTYTLAVVRIEGAGPALDATLTYNSRDLRRGPFGAGWVHGLDQRLVETTDGVNVYAICTQPDGRREQFVRTPTGAYVPPPYLFATLTRAADGTFTLRDKQGLLRIFRADGRLGAIQDRNGNTLALSYDAAGFLTGVRDGAGRALLFVKGPDGRVASITDPLQRTFGFGYDAAGNLTAYTNPLGHVSRFQYDAASNLTSMVDPRNNTLLRLTYDAAGRVSQHVDGPTTWTYTYSPASRRTTKRDGQGRTWTFDYGDNGNITRVVNPLGRAKEHLLDASLNVVQITDANGAVTRYTYDNAGNPVTITDALGNTRRMTYEATFNQLLSMQDPRGNVTRYQYDSQGNLTDVLDALGNRTTLAYDARGLVTRITDAVGATTFAYDAAGNLVRYADALGRATTATFDAAGRASSITDQEGRTTRLSYDAADRLTQTVNALGGVTTNEFDPAGNRSGITTASGAKTTAAYDAFNRLVSQTNQLGQSITYGYDIRGNLTSRRNRRGQQTTLTYDNLDRVTRKSSTSDTVNYTYDHVGRVITVTNNGANLAFDYDAVGRLTRAHTLSQPVTTITYAYDANGQRVSMSGPGSEVIAYAYDNLSRLVSMTESSGDVHTFGYDAASRRTSLAGPLQRAVTYQWDAADQLTQLVDRAPGSDLGLSYAYTASGQVSTRNEGPQTSTYQYDALSRLTRATHSAAPTAESYTLDAVGNRVSSHLSAQHTHDALNRLLSDGIHDYVYDADGNLTRKTHRPTGRITNYTYDADDRLIGVAPSQGATVSYRYDGLGRRVAKTMATVTTAFVYDGSDIVREYVGGVLSASYTHGPDIDEPLSVRRGGVSSYFQADALGSVVRTVTASGLQHGSVYDSYGRVVFESGTAPSPYGFMGREYDRESGLYYFRNRYYDPESGRFLTEDPIGLVGSLNFYEFVASDPINLVDPFGLQPGEPVPGAPRYRYRIDMNQQPHPNMHVYHPNGDETIIRHTGGWKQGQHRGRRLVPLPRDKAVRKAVRGLATKFVKKAGRFIPLVGLVFLMADAAEAAELASDPCSTLGDFVNIVVPYKDVLELGDALQ